MPEYVSLVNNTIKNGHYVDVADDELNMLSMLMYAFIYTIDDLFEQCLVDTRPQNVEFAIDLYRVFRDSMSSQEVPLFKSQIGLDDDLVIKGNLFRQLLLVLIEKAKHLMEPSHFRAWQKVHHHYAHYYVEFEAVVSRLSFVQKRPITGIEYLLTRTVCAGLLVATPYFLRPEWDLDRNFVLDSYLYRMSSTNLSLTHDLWSAPKERDTMSSVKILDASGLDRHLSELKTVDTANQVMVELKNYHDQCPAKSNFIFAAMRTNYQITRYQLVTNRYNWEPITSIDSTDTETIVSN